MSTHLIGPSDGGSVWFAGLGTRFLVDGERTAGALAVVEHELAPRELGAPVHAHEREDEISHVTAGRLGVQVGDEVLEANPGDTVFKPRGIPHAFWNPGDEPARFLELITPAGFERYFSELEPIFTSGGPPDLEAIGALAARYGLTMDMASLPRLIAEHRLNAPPGAPGA